MWTLPSFAIRCRLTLLRRPGGLLLLAALAVAAGGTAGRAAENTSPLTNAQQVLDLKPIDAYRLMLPVRLRGVITFHDVHRGWLFVQDETAGVLVLPTDSQPVRTPGEQVEIEGVSGNGVFAPFVDRAAVRVTGRGPLPHPHRATLEEISANRLFGQYSEVSGVVRDAIYQYGRLTLLLADGTSQGTLSIWGAPRELIQEPWLEARVRARGVNWQGEGDFKAQTRADIVVLNAGTTNIFDRTNTSVAALRGDPGERQGGRVKVAATLQFRTPGGLLFLRAEDRGLRAEPLRLLRSVDPDMMRSFGTADPPWQPGDRLEVVGEPMTNAAGLTLRDAQCRLAGPGEVAPALRVGAAALAARGHECELVTVRGELVQYLTNRLSGSWRRDELVLREGGQVFTVSLETGVSNPPVALEADQMVEATGFVVRPDPAGRAFHLIARGPGDLRRLGLTPAARWRQVRQVSGGVGMAAAVAAGWILFLRRKIARQAREARERESLHAALRESELKFRLLFERNSDAILILDSRQFKFTDCNEATVRMLRAKSKEEVCNTHPAALSPEVQPDGRNSYEKADEIIQRMYELGSQRFEWMHRRLDGEDFLVEVSLTSVQLADRPIIVTVWREIGDRKRAEAAIRDLNATLERRVAERTAELEQAYARLRESEDRFSKAFRASPALVTISRLADGCYLDVNDAFLRTFGFRREEVLGRNSVDIGLWKDAAQREEFLAALRRDGMLRDFEAQLLGRGPGPVPLLISAELIDIQGQPHVLAVGLDIATRKRAEEELRRGLDQARELSQLKSNFVSMVSHEFRTPLGVISVSSEVLSRYFDRLTPDQRAEHLGAIVENVRRMSRMMEDVLLLSRVDSGRLEFKPVPVDLAAFCRKLVDEVHSATNRACPIEVDCALAPEDPARADEALLRHILTNLLSNAVKYSPPGSPVSLRVARADGQAVLEVADRGMGIPAADQPRLFSAFHRARNVEHIHGTGLGLVIVKRCCDLHGGAIDLRSEEGRGTTFRVRLPLFPPSTP